MKTKIFLLMMILGLSSASSLVSAADYSLESIHENMRNINRNFLEGVEALLEKPQKLNKAEREFLAAYTVRMAETNSPHFIPVLFYRLKSEIDRQNPGPNSQVIRVLLDAIQRIATVDWRDDLDVLKEEAFERLTDPAVNLSESKIEKTILKFEEVAQEVGARTELPRPRFPAALVHELERLSLRELIIRDFPEDKQVIAAFRAIETGVARNFYDEYVNRLNDGEELPNFFGREIEIQKLSEAMLRVEKGHAFLTGQAGVGKTTLMKILMARYLSGEASYPGSQIPVLLEIPITTLAAKNPNELLKLVGASQLLATALDRDFILFADEAHVVSSMNTHAIKSKLTEMLTQDQSRVHMVWATTSSEARSLMEDKAFRRRWVDVFVPEFSQTETVRAIQTSHVPIWRKEHQSEEVKFSAIDPRAFEYAYRYGHLEQRFGANPTATKELLEGAIVAKFESLQRRFRRGEELSEEERNFTLTSADIQAYLRRAKNMKLIPGDPSFNENFELSWEEFNSVYVGNEGFKYELKGYLRSHFGNPTRTKMLSLVVMGPPGGGKTYAAEKIAKYFFDGAILGLNGADYKQSYDKSRLSGSAPGLVGYKEGTSEFAKFFADHPNGGVIKIEEADYLHKDVIQQLVNMITDGEFVDSHGNRWKTDQYVLWLNTNIAQDYLLPPPGLNEKMTWEQYETRRAALTEGRVVDGREIEMVRKERLDQGFDRFLYKVVTQSGSHVDTSTVGDEALKQRRRYNPLYVLTPDRSELEAAAKLQLAKFTDMAEENYGVRFEIAEETLDRILDLDHYEFEKGYNYVENQIEDKLVRFLTPHLHQRDKTISVKVEDSIIELGEEEVPSEELHIAIEGEELIVHSLDHVLARGENTWANSTALKERIARFEPEMKRYIEGADDFIQSAKELMELKLIDYKTRLVFTLIGTSGNGKTAMAKAMAKALFGSESALFTMAELNNESQLNSFFRPPAGYVGSWEETAFERWFEARRHAGGGVILMDELLSFYGLGAAAKSEKIRVMNRIYTFLDEGFIEIRGQKMDARGFVVVVTGNSMQELFDGIGDTPESEKLVKKVLSQIRQKDIHDYFRKQGIDAPKLARLGLISVRGPLPDHVAQRVGRKMLDQFIREDVQLALAEQRRSQDLPTIEVDDRVTEEVVKRVKTVRLGMRKVNDAFRQVVMTSLSGILIAFPDAKRITATVDRNGKLVWKVNRRRVYKVAYEEEGIRRTRWQKGVKDGEKVITPQFGDLEEPVKTKLSELQIRKTAIHEVYGHWMTSVLLFGKNEVETISIIPGEGYLGFVRRMKEKEYTANTLSTLLKRVAYLEAGHRALFVHGVYGTGGGRSGRPRTPERWGNDDLGKVERTYDQILSNQLLPEYTEFDAPEKRLEFKNRIRHLMKEVTDRVVQFGVQQEYFKGVYDLAVSERYLSQEVLDAIVKEKRDVLPDADFVYLYFLEQVIGEETEAKTENGLYREILRKSMQEIQALRSMKGDAVSDRFKEWMDRTTEKYALGTKRELVCEGLL